LLEFALVLPIFLLLLLGIMEFSSVFFVRHAMLNAAREAARSYAIQEFTAGDAEQLALDLLSGTSLDYIVTASPQTDTGVERWVEVTVPTSDAALGDPLGLFGGGDLQVRVTMRREE
jgi:Flp pilus assembly protein TadG